MSQYQPSLGDIGFLLKQVFDFDRHARQCGASSLLDFPDTAWQA